jgi:hypothetical protein
LEPTNPIQQVSGTQDESDDSPVDQADEELTLAERAKKANTRTMNFLAGREQEDLPRAKELFRQGDATFREAAAMPREQSAKTFE